ncbi:MAG: glycosyltransferase [Candidatus Helarchaeota archaeon]|nr:glycosyltransferase [Candidatus Helarchaeota archaeon]
MKKLRCLYVSRYAPNRTRTDPYTGLPWYLSERTSLVGLWGRPGRSVPFENHCEEIIETNSDWWAIPRSFFAVWQFLRGYKGVDAVVCGIDEYSLSVGLFAGKLADAPVFCVVEDPPFTDRYCQQIGWRRKREKQIRRLVLKTLLNFCSGIFCFIEKGVLNEINLDNVEIHQLMNGVSSQALAWVRKRPGIEKEASEYVIGYVGAINKKQGIEDLLEIFAAARRKLPKLRLQLIGPLDDDYTRSYQAKISDLALDSSVRITGWLPYEKMLERLQECDICVYCNPATEWFRFAQPLKICEYLALEKPTIAWDYPGTRRMLNHGRYGILVPPGNKSAFVDALVSVADPTASRHMENEIHAALQGHWSSDYWYNHVLDILASAREG